MSTGYDPSFIPGENIPLPALGPTAAAAAFNNGQVIDHPRFSLTFQERGFALSCFSG